VTTGRRAIALTPMETRLDVIMRAAELADELGYEAVQVPEGWGLDATLLLSQLIPRTRRITLVTSVLSIWGRTPATLAMGAATLHTTSGGRHILGLGASSPALVEGLHNRVFERPSEKLREVATAVRSLLDGGRCVVTTGRGARPLRLGLPPTPELPIWLAAIGPRSVRVAAEIADGWCPAWVSRERLTSQAAAMAGFRVSAGLRGAPLTIVAGPLAVAAESATEARTRAAGIVAWYMCAMGEWSKLVAAQGYAAEVASVRAANPRPDLASGVVPTDAVALLDAYTAHGTAADVRAQVAGWDDVADIVSVVLPPGLPWELLDATIRACAPGHDPSPSPASA
jgi:alkanesulfonate monooxygenase SsuD/methylene tetrahydromethanopterin reductase-like flavin-dependent oxidoreductase (luciferase family)